MKKFIYLALPASLLALSGCDTGGGAAPVDNAVAVNCDTADATNETEAAACPEGTEAERPLGPNEQPR